MTSGLGTLVQDPLMILKYASLSATIFYGIVATLVDFRVEKGGRKRFSRWGYFGIAVLLASSGLGLASEWARDENEHQQRLAEEADRDSARARAVRGEQEVLGRLQEQLANLNTLRAMSENASAQQAVQLGRQEVLLDEQHRVAFNAACPAGPACGRARETRVECGEGV
jgi:hypothetical protein